MAWVSEYETAVRANAQGYGYTDEKGRIMAPANADPYLRMAPVVDMIFSRCNLFLNPIDRKRITRLLFRVSYKEARTVFRRGAKQVVEAFQGTNTYVVTNSETDAVEKKMRRLGAIWLSERVYGLAQKFVLVDDWDLVPETMTLPGLNRPVYLRRKHYFNILDQLRREAGAEWSEVVVVGDIFELDLALPLALGASVVLVANENTPQYEIDFVESHPRGRIIRDLKDLPAPLS